MDLLVYPVMFLYRHYLEISLKHILIVLRKYFEDSSTLPTHHRLNTLWGLVRSLMEKQWNSVEHVANYEAIGDRIREFHGVDELSFSFRYPVTKRVCDKSPFPLGEGWGEGVPLLTQELQMPLKTATYSEKWICHTPSKENVSSLTNVPNVYASGRPVINLKQVKEVVREMAMFLEGTIDMVADYEEGRGNYLDWVQQEYGC